MPNDGSKLKSDAEHTCVKVLESDMASMFLETGGARGAPPQQSETAMQLDAKTDSVDPWAYTYDRDGRCITRQTDWSRVASKGPRKLVVEILAARDLHSADLGGTSDPYCMLDLGASRHRTETVFRTLHPAWGERFDFVAAKELEADSVECQVFDEDRFGSHTFLGGVTIPIHAVEEGDANVAAHWVRLQPKKPPPEPFRGTLALACYMDADVPGRLHVGVVRASSIESADFGGRSDPYVRVHLLRSGNEQVRKDDDVRRTKVLYKTLNPAWNEKFVFEHVDKQGNSQVLLELFDHDVISADDAMAQIVLPVSTLPRARHSDRQASPTELPWQEHSGNRSVSGEVNLMIYFVDTLKTKLCVRLIKAKNIKAADMGGTSDPYVLAKLPTGVKGVRGREDQIYRTKVVFATVGPVWNHNMFFRVFPSTIKQLQDSTGSSKGFLGAVASGVYTGAEWLGSVGSCAALPTNLPDPNDKGVKKKASLLLRTIHAVGGSEIETNDVDVQQRKVVEREMVTKLGGTGGKAGKQAGMSGKQIPKVGLEEVEKANVGEGINGPTTTAFCSTTQTVKGQVLELDLYDADDGGIFDRDDFLGRILIPLESVLTIAQGGDKKSLWIPWKEKHEPPVKGEICIRAYFPDPGDVPEGQQPRDLISRLDTKAAVQAGFKRRRLKEEALEMYRELESQLLIQLRYQAWPPDIAAKYARAYARHGHEHHLIPTPPEGCTIPASFFHMFETAAAAAKLVPGSTAESTNAMMQEEDARRAKEASGSGVELVEGDVETFENVDDGVAISTGFEFSSDEEGSDIENTESNPEITGSAAMEKASIRNKQLWDVAKRVFDAKIQQTGLEKATMNTRRRWGVAKIILDTKVQQAELARINADMFKDIVSMARKLHQKERGLAEAASTPYRLHAKQGYPSRQKAVQAKKATEVREAAAAAAAEATTAAAAAARVKTIPWAVVSSSASAACGRSRLGGR